MSKFKLTTKDIENLLSLTLGDSHVFEYDPYDGYIYWLDEYTVDFGMKLSSDAHDFYRALLAARNLCYYLPDPRDFREIPLFMQDAWLCAMDKIPGWIGFNRLDLPEPLRSEITEFLRNPPSDDEWL